MLARGVQTYWSSHRCQRPGGMKHTLQSSCDVFTKISANILFNNVLNAGLWHNIAAHSCSVISRDTHTVILFVQMLTSQATTFKQCLCGRLVKANFVSVWLSYCLIQSHLAAAFSRRWHRSTTLLSLHRNSYHLFLLREQMAMADFVARH